MPCPLRCGECSLWEQAVAKAVEAQSGADGEQEAEQDTVAEPEQVHEGVLPQTSLLHEAMLPVQAAVATREWAA